MIEPAEAILWSALFYVIVVYCLLLIVKVLFIKNPCYVLPPPPSRKDAGELSRRTDMFLEYYSTHQRKSNESLS